MKSTAVALFLPFLFLCCTNGHEPTPQKDAVPGAIAVKLERRSIPSDVYWIVATLERADYSTLADSVTVGEPGDSVTMTLHGVAEGPWSLTLLAKDDAGKSLYAGTAPIFVKAGETVVAYVVMNKLDQTGNIEIHIIWGDEHGVNRALRFDGTPSLVSFANSSLLEPAQVTVEMLVRFDTLLTMTPLLSATDVNQWNTADGYGLKYEQGMLYFMVASANNVSNSMGKDTVMPLHKWVHIAGTFDQQYLRLYMDGHLVMERESPGTIYYGTKGFVLGQGYHSSFGDNYFVGSMDEVRIWGVVRTQEELAEDMFKRLSGTEPGLLGYWNFDQMVSDSLVWDQTLNGNNGSIIGNVRFEASDAF